jgi:Rho-binding antiterminator
LFIALSRSRSEQLNIAYDTFHIDKGKLMTLPYAPVSCDLYERLEELAVHGQQCEILYRDGTGRTERVRDRIASLPIREKAEYLQLEAGTLIRLDALIELDGASYATNPYPPKIARSTQT